MLNADYFTMRPAADYVGACERLPRTDLMANTLAFESPSMLSAELGARLAARGIPPDEALAVSHTLIARRV
jgi:hypothetical protein